MSGIGTLSPRARRTLLLLFVSTSILSALPLVARAGNGQVMTALVVSQVVVQHSPITPHPQPTPSVLGPRSLRWCPFWRQTWTTLSRSSQAFAPMCTLQSQPRSPPLQSIRRSSLLGKRQADIDQLEKKFPGIREHVQFALASQAPAEVRQLVNFPVWVQKGDNREAFPEDVHAQICARDGAAGVVGPRHQSRSPRRQSSSSGANAQSEGRSSLDLPAVNSSPGASKSTRTKKSVKEEGPAGKYAKLAADLQQQVHLAASQATSVSSQASPSN